MAKKYLDFSKFDVSDYRQDQFNNAVFKQHVSSIDEIKTFPKELREKVASIINFPSIKVSREVESKDGATKKVLFVCEDGLEFEAVLMMHKDGRNTVCVSSQIGCKMGCTFCATGTMGLLRDLSYREIVDQVLYFARELDEEEERVSNIVFMGMGEPMNNLNNVMKAVDVITDEAQFNLGNRKLTISTVGVIEPMTKFFRKFPQINLAISLHSANEEKRRELMPRASKTSLTELATYIRFHISEYNRRVSLEYILINDLNDGDKDVQDLKAFFEMVGEDAYKLLHVNLIPYNDTSNVEFQSPCRASVNEFNSKLNNIGINSTIRVSMGQDIDSACGMLKLSE